MRKALEKAQFEAWPDSVILTDAQMMRAMQSEPRWVQDLTIENWPEKGQYTDVERGFVFLTYKQTETRAQQLLWIDPTTPTGSSTPAVRAKTAPTGTSGSGTG
jgi:hypothetical protein